MKPLITVKEKKKVYSRSAGRKGDAKLDCRIAGARCSENGGSGDKKITTNGFSLEIAGGLL
jgi:hypothetical protein